MPSDLKNVPYNKKRKLFFYSENIKINKLYILIIYKYYISKLITTANFMLYLDFPVYFKLSKLRLCEKLLKENTNLSKLFVTLERVYQIFFTLMCI